MITLCVTKNRTGPSVLTFRWAKHCVVNMSKNWGLATLGKNVADIVTNKLPEMAFFYLFFLIPILGSKIIFYISSNQILAQIFKV